MQMRTPVQMAEAICQKLDDIANSISTAITWKLDNRRAGAKYHSRNAERTGKY